MNSVYSILLLLAITISTSTTDNRISGQGGHWLVRQCPPTLWLHGCFLRVFDGCTDNAQRSRCIGNRKCCPTVCTRLCLQTKDIWVKDGFCPASADVDPPFFCVLDNCYEDSECPGRQKCCPSKCSNRMIKMCTNPLQNITKPKMKRLNDV